MNRRAPSTSARPPAKPKVLKPIEFERDVAGEDQEIGPGDLAAVFLLDRPQQATRLVEVGVVRPAVERREALLSVSGAAAPVMDAIGAGAVPRHPDEQAARNGRSPPATSPAKSVITALRSLMTAFRSRLSNSFT